MDQVSNFLDSFLVTEQQEPKNKATTEEMKLLSPSSLKLNTTLSASDKIISAPKYVSLFWYLESDHKKVANHMTDKLIERVLNVIIDPLVVTPNAGDARLEMHLTRPPLSFNLMNLNSTKFAQRISPVYVLFDDITYMMQWRDPYFTVGVLLIGTLLILHPHLATAVPPFILLKHYMIPSYMKLYLPDPLFVDGKFTFQNPILSEQKLDKFEPPKPVPQLSREFIMNFTDMQNHLVPYIRLYDALTNWGQHYFLFEDPKLSCVTFLVLWVIMLANVTVLPMIFPLILKFIPVQFISILFLWSCVGALHPTVRGMLLDRFYTEEARLSRLNKTDKIETRLMDALEPEEDPADILREVEMFELHRLSAKNIWEPIGFTTNFFAFNDPMRAIISELRAHSIEALDETESKSEDKVIHPELPRKATPAEIKPPENWSFTEAEWRIDCEPLAWVKANYIMDLVSVDTDEKWVYDFAEENNSPDGDIYRRRRWVRRCQRETVAQRKARETMLLAASNAAPTGLGKTISTFLA